MGAAGNERPSMRKLDELPEFELHHHVEDSGDQVALTVYPGDRDGKLADQWLSIDLEFVLPIEETR